jgi:hypothetical protein
LNLSPDDRGSRLTREILSHIESKLTKYRNLLEGDMTKTKTARLRGKIAALKELQTSLTTEAPKAPQPHQNPYK